VKIW